MRRRAVSGPARRRVRRPVEVEVAEDIQTAAHRHEGGVRGVEARDSRRSPARARPDPSSARRAGEVRTLTDVAAREVAEPRPRRRRCRCAAAQVGAGAPASRRRTSGWNEYGGLGAGRSTFGWYRRSAGTRSRRSPSSTLSGGSSRSSSTTLNPCGVSNMCSCSRSPLFICRSVAGFGFPVSGFVMSEIGSGGACGLPLYVRYAQLTGSRARPVPAGVVVHTAACSGRC